jgi:transposase-like protein
MKSDERQEARKLRGQGLSIKEITRRVGVAKSSVSRWVRDIELTDEQRMNLRPCTVASGINRLRHFSELRDSYREAGRDQAKKNNLLHAMGCMLYWAEGWHTNNRNCMKFSNSSVPMMKMFLKFLRNEMSVKDNDVIIRIHCYTDKRSASDIESYWLNELGLPQTGLRKTVADKRPGCTQNKRNNILEWGTCHLIIHDVRVVQGIYGAIEEYGKFRNGAWD